MKKIAAVLYYVMLWCRPVFMIFSRLIQFFFTAWFLLILVTNLLVDDSPTSWWTIAFSGGLAFGVFMLRERYDQILLRLNPTDNDLILFK
ncbi:MAG TPA: hypothetical protein VD886_05200 [Herpetosiphonaceae bacterium]|nr:hypothetical protein [Herpetosiphonaceae bacterium]